MLQPIDLSDDALAGRVIIIQRAAYRCEADLIGFDGIPPLHEDVDDIRRHDLQWLGAWEDRVLVGLIAWSTTDTACEIDRLAVHPEFMRRGHGRALVGSVSHPHLVAVSTGTLNTPAMTLYESVGFVRVGTREIAPGVTVTQLHRRH